MTRALVVIPTYNEATNIAPLIRAIQACGDFHTLVVDDRSPDGTADQVKSLQSEFSEQVFLLERPGKLGLGTAYGTGFRWALERKYELILQMDADFSHPCRELTALTKACESGVDLALGSRYVEGGGIENWPFSRRMLSRFGNLYAQWVLSAPIRDLTGGFKCWRRDTLSAVLRTSIRSEGYAFQVEMTYRAFRMGFKIKEIPILFSDRTRGKSKMSSRIVWEAMVRIPWLRMSARPGRAARIGV